MIGLVATWLALPAALRWGLLLALAAPLAGWPVWVRGVGRKAPPIATQLAGRAAMVVAFVLASLSTVAVLTVARAGLEARSAVALSAVTRHLDHAGSAWSGGAAPRKSVVADIRLGDPEIDFAALAPYPCAEACMITASIGTEDDRLAGNPGLQRLARRPAAVSVGALLLGGRPMVLARGAVRDPDGRAVGLLIVGVSADDIVSAARTFALQLLFVTLLLVAATTVLTRTVLTRTLTRRVRELIGNLDTGQAEPDAGDELSLLSQRVDQLVRRSVDLETQLHQTQKMEAVGRLTGGIAHDFNNLLTVIRANVSLLRGQAPAAEVEDIDRAAARGAALVRRLLAFGRQGSLELEGEDAGRLLHDVMGMLRRVLPDSVVLELPARIPSGSIEVDRTAFDQIILNLVNNARDAMPAGGTLRVSAEVQRPDPADAGSSELDPNAEYLVITISDSGHGMDEATLARAFDPFFTTKAPDRGTGLGLAIVYGLMKRHRGVTRIRSTPADGTAVSLWFPHHPARVTGSGGGMTATPPEAVKRGQKLLLIEDEEIVRRTTELILQRLGFRVTTATNGQEGLDRLADAGPFALVVSDVQMPVMTGAEFVRRAREGGATLPILLVSGYGLEDVEPLARTYRDVSLLGKPWTAVELGNALARLLSPTTDRPQPAG